MKKPLPDRLTYRLLFANISKRHILLKFIKYRAAMDKEAARRCREESDYFT
jgi:hypothetical protein